VSHLICGGVHDWSTGLIFKGGRYFDPSLGIWLALTPLVVLQSWLRRERSAERRGRKRKRRGMPWYVMVLLVMGVGGMLAGCEGCDTPTPTCTPTLPPGTPTPTPPTTPPPTPTPPPYGDRDPRDPGPYDADILAASVVIAPVNIRYSMTASLGTIVGYEGSDLIIYTHNHFREGENGAHLHEKEVTGIKIYNHDRSSHINLYKVPVNPDSGLEYLDFKLEYAGQRTKLKVRESALSREGSAAMIGRPIAKVDGAAASVGNEVDIAYYAPPGAGGNHVEIWHTRVVERSNIPAGIIAVLGAPAPGEAFGPGGYGDSGGGLFREGTHIGHSWQWWPDVVIGENSATGERIPVRHSDAHWISFLNP
jgi:hypothetical protein